MVLEALEELGQQEVQAVLVELEAPEALVALEVLAAQEVLEALV